MPNLNQRKYPAEQDYPDLRGYHNSMAKVLTPQMYAKYRDVVTESGFTFDQVIQTGVDNHGHPSIAMAGCVAGDAECYVAYKDFYAAVIEHRHGGYPRQAKQELERECVGQRVRDGHLPVSHVQGVRVCACRSLLGLPLPPHCNRTERREVERIATDALATLQGKLAGRYHPLRSLEQQEELRGDLSADHILFEKPTCPVLVSEGLTRDWPDARGVFHNQANDFVVWVNEEEHMRVMALSEGGNMTGVFQTFCEGIDKIEAALHARNQSFEWNDHLGYIVACPSNLGSGLRASVQVRLPRLCRHECFGEILHKLRLNRKTLAECDVEEGVCDISNADRLGISRLDAVQLVVDGVRALIDMEKQLAEGQDIQDLIPSKQVSEVNGHELLPRRRVPEECRIGTGTGDIGTVCQSLQELLPRREGSSNSIQVLETEL